MKVNKYLYWPLYIMVYCLFFVVFFYGFSTFLKSLDYYRNTAIPISFWIKAFVFSCIDMGLLMLIMFLSYGDEK